MDVNAHGVSGIALNFLLNALEDSNGFTVGGNSDVHLHLITVRFIGQVNKHAGSVQEPGVPNRYPDRTFFLGVLVGGRGDFTRANLKGDSSGLYVHGEFLRVVVAFTRHPNGQWEFTLSKGFRSEGRKRRTPCFILGQGQFPTAGDGPICRDGGTDGHVEGVLTVAGVRHVHGESTLNEGANTQGV